jgi:hypothetical protein
MSLAARTHHQCPTCRCAEPLDAETAEALTDVMKPGRGRDPGNRDQRARSRSIASHAIAALGREVLRLKADDEPEAARDAEAVMNALRNAHDIRLTERPASEGKQTVTDPIMKHFAFEHLPEHLQAVSRPFGELARQMDQDLPDGPEKSAGLRKLIEAKDCMVRAKLG